MRTLLLSVVALLLAGCGGEERELTAVEALSCELHGLEGSVCTEAGGMLDCNGMPGTPCSCGCPTRDGGASCTGAEQCEGRYCIAEGPDDAVGACSGSTVVRGRCAYFLDEQPEFRCID